MTPIPQSYARRLRYAAGIALGLSLAAPVFSQSYPSPRDEARLYELAKKEATVVWYESAPLEPMKALAQEFEKKYPGVRVEVLRIVGVAQYQRFMQETQAKRHLVDVVNISDYPSMQSLMDDGHLAEWQVPTHDRFPPVFRMRNFAYSAYTTDTAIVYNANKLLPEEVKILESSWKGVLDPRFKGRFAVTSMKCGVCYAGIHMFLDPKFKDEYGPNFLRQVAAQKPAVYAEVLVALDRVVAGEHDFTFWTWESIANTKWMQGAPVRWIRPSPTPDFGNTWQAVSKYAPHPHAARLFQNWFNSEEGALALMDKYGSGPILTGVADRRKVSKEAWYRPIKQRYDVDFKRWDRDYHKDMDMWIKMLQEAR